MFKCEKYIPRLSVLGSLRVDDASVCLCAHNRGIEGKKARKGDREIQECQWYLF